jgi:uncharacterized membrane protein YhaH (DUF805 family)
MGGAMGDEPPVSPGGYVNREDFLAGLIWPLAMLIIALFLMASILWQSPLAVQS